MGTTIRFGSPEWRSLWNSRTEVFRNEARQQYTVPSEYDPEIRRGWFRRVGDARDRGLPVTRVRVVRYPVNDYTRTELASFAENVHAGERVLIIDGGRLADAAERAGDFDLFGRTLVRLNYDDQGRPVNATLIRNPLLVARACRLRNRLLAAAEPYHDYMNRRVSPVKTG